MSYLPHCPSVYCGGNCPASAYFAYCSAFMYPCRVQTSEYFEQVCIFCRIVHLCTVVVVALHLRVLRIAVHSFSPAVWRHVNTLSRYELTTAFSICVRWWSPILCGWAAFAYVASGLHVRIALCFALYVCTVYCVVCCVLQYIGRCIALYVCADVLGCVFRYIGRCIALYVCTVYCVVYCGTLGAVLRCMFVLCFALCIAVYCAVFCAVCLCCVLRCVLQYVGWCIALYVCTVYCGVCCVLRYIAPYFALYVCADV
jgi:hypothetical protein